MLLAVLTAPLALAAGAGISVDLSSSSTAAPSKGSGGGGAGDGVTTQAAGDITDLQLTKADSADPVAVGQTFIYYLNITNAGSKRANDIVVTDTLPAGVTYVSASGGCTRSGSTVTCTRNNLNAGNSASFAITVTAASVGNWTNTASATMTETDSNTANNQDNETTRVLPAAPGEPTCFADPDGVHLDWNDVAGATSYNVYRRTGDTGDFVLLASTTSSDHLDGTAAVGQSYQYRVTAVASTGESAPSPHCTIASVPEFPTLFAGAIALAGCLGAFAWMRRR